MATFRIEQPLRLVSRTRDGRWLGGVCAGIGRARGIHPAWIRGGFVLAGLFGGVGALAYLACWLIIPAEDEAPDARSSRWLVALAKGCATCLGLVMLGILAAAATLFGLGWIAVVLAAAALVAVLVSWPRLGPAWALLPLAAIALPAAAVAASGVGFATNAGNVTVAPRVLAPGGVATFRAGLGTLLVDLRHTQLPASGTLNVRVQGGVRRTIVALPQDRCVHFDVSYAIHPFWSQVASLVAGHGPSHGVVVFGNFLPDSSGHVEDDAPPSGPVLNLHFSSAGGSLYVRDYPDTVDPDDAPDWPGFPVVPEQRPNVRELSKRQARDLLASWRTRHAAEVREREFVAVNTPGPCATRPGTAG